MRVCLLLDKNVLQGAEWEDFAQLDSHEEDIYKREGSWQGYGQLIDVVRKYSKTKQPWPVVHKVACTIMTNSLPLHDAGLNLMGTILHPQLAMINHSCVPNAVLRTDVSPHYSSSSSPNPIIGSISVHALRPIAAGEEITIDYSDQSQTRSQIQHNLKDRYFFKCTCERCDPASPAHKQDPVASEALTWATELLENNTGFFGMSEVRVFSHRAALTALASLNGTDSAIGLMDYPYVQHRYQLTSILNGDRHLRGSLNAMQDDFLYTAILLYRGQPESLAKPFGPLALATHWKLVQCARRLATELRKPASTGARSQVWRLLNADKVELFAMTTLSKLKQILDSYPFFQNHAVDLDPAVKVEDAANDDIAMTGAPEVTIKVEQDHNSSPSNIAHSRGPSPAPLHMSSLMNVMVDELIAKVQNTNERIVWSRLRIDEDKIQSEVKAWINGEIDHQLEREKSGIDWRISLDPSERERHGLSDETLRSVGMMKNDYQTAIKMNQDRFRVNGGPNGHMQALINKDGYSDKETQAMAVQEARGRPLEYRHDGMVITKHYNVGEALGPESQRNFSTDDLE
jgi:hypothetical protein